jgi:MtaA/CmuA family methyltransferase
VIWSDFLVVLCASYLLLLECSRTGNYFFYEYGAGLAIRLEKDRMLAKKGFPMNSLERIGAAIHLQIPDRVPVDLHNFQTAAFATGLPMSEVFRNGALLAEAMLQAWREFGHDMILLENGTACNAQACGMEVIYQKDSAPVAEKPLISSLVEVVGLEVRDPYKAFPMCEILKATRILSKELGDRVWICARADQGPMDLAAQLRGMDALMMDIATGEEEEAIHALLDYARRVATRYALALIECGGHSTSIGEPIGGPDLMSPRHYRQYAWPQEKRMVDELKQHGVILHNHICGKTDRIVEEFVATGAQVLEIDHKTDPHKIKDAARNRTCLLGAIDTGLMAFGKPDEIDAACKNLIEIWKPDSGFILGPGCALAPQVPAANIHALIEAAERYGRY